MSISETKMTDLVEQCPLPELAEALKPYIRPREEVAEIRTAIDDLLAEHAKNDDIPLSRTTLPVSDTAVNQALDSPFTGVRRAFIRALIARQKAQAQYDALKLELGLLQDQSQNYGGCDARKDEEESPVAQTVALIRQRQRREKLLIIEQSLDNLEKARQNSRYSDPSELLNGSMQSQQPPPLAQQNQDEYLLEAQSHVFELQKAVLRAQNKLQSKDYGLDSSQNTSLKNSREPESWRRAYALRKARDDLIAWIEGELAKLSEDEGPDPQDDTQTQHDTDSLDEIRTTLQELYDTYITSRELLVRTLNTKALLAITTKPSPSETRSEFNESRPRGIGLASKILPYVESLRSTAQDEAALMQHTSYIRRQLTAVSSDTDQLITRLSDESHMVRPGTLRTSAWTEAATEASIRDLEAIHSNLVTGEASIGAAREILASSQGSS